MLVVLSCVTRFWLGEDPKEISSGAQGRLSPRGCALTLKYIPVLNLFINFNYLPINCPLFVVGYQ